MSSQAAAELTHCAVLGADAGVAVDRAEADDDEVVVEGAGEEVAAALAAVVLRLAVGRCQVRIGSAPVRISTASRATRAFAEQRGAGPLLAAVAVAVAGELERRPHLEADRTAAAATEQRVSPATAAHAVGTELAPRHPAAPEREEDDRDHVADSWAPISNAIDARDPGQQRAEQGVAEGQVAAPARSSRRSPSRRPARSSQPQVSKKLFGRQDREDREEDADRDQLDERGAPEEGGVDPPASTDEAFFAAEFFGEPGEAFDFFFQRFDPFFEFADLPISIRRSLRDFFDRAAQFFDLAFELPEFFPGRFARRPCRPLLAVVPARALLARPALPARSAPAAPAPSRSPRSARRRRSPGR